MDKKYTVKLFGGGRMGEIAQQVLEMLPNVELVDSLKADIIFSASWPKKIPEDVIKYAVLGAVNIHTGLLPDCRGYHPLNWAIIWGRKVTGITIHKITDTLDGGDVCLQEEVPIFDTDNIVRLRERIEDVFPKLISVFFNDPEGFLKEAKQQNQALASYAQKRRAEDSELNMSASARDIYNLYRSCHPVEYPAFFFRDGVKYIITDLKLRDDGETLDYEYVEA